MFFRKHAMMAKRTVLFASLTLISAGITQAQISGSLWLIGSDTGAATDAQLSYGDPSSGSYLGTPDATFSAGAFDFNPTDDGSIYTVGPFLNNPTFNNQSANFITAGGANAGLDDVYMYFTGSIYLNAGNNSFVVGHDDGVQLNIDGIGQVVDATGPTALDETPFDVDAPSAGTYNFELSYAECCGPPASLVWDINNVPVGTPDAATTMGLLGLSLGTLGVFSRRMKK